MREIDLFRVSQDFNKLVLKYLSIKHENE